MASILIANALTVNEGRSTHQDLLIRDGRIDAIGGDLSGRETDQVIDADGRALLPGMIDDQVHFREPGLTHKGDIRSESRAAVAGGITSYMEMPNTSPPTTTIDLLEEKHRIARKTSFANYSFYLGGANDNIEAVKRLDPRQACGVKVFMGASTGNMLVDDPIALEQIFTHSQTIVATHCEDSPTIDENTRRFQAIHGEDIPITLHPVIRSEAACYRSTALAVELARRCDTRLHILHLSTAKELTLLFDAIGGKTDHRRGLCPSSPLLGNRLQRKRQPDQMQPGHQNGGRPPGTAGGIAGGNDRRCGNGPRTPHAGGKAAAVHEGAFGTATGPACPGQPAGTRP